MVAAHDAEIVIHSENSRSCGAGRGSESSSAESAGAAIETTGDRVTRAMRKPGEHLDADVDRSQTCCIEIRISLGGSDAIGGHVERIHDVRAKQIGIPEGECLCQTGFSSLNGIERVLVDFVSGRRERMVKQVSAEYGVIGAALIVDPADCHVIIFEKGCTVSEFSAWV